MMTQTSVEICVRGAGAAQNDVLRPSEPLPPSAILERRFEKGRQFEREVFDDLLALHPGAMSIDRGDPAEREAATSEAIASGGW
jgi:hypothetical protein